MHLCKAEAIRPFFPPPPSPPQTNKKKKRKKKREKKRTVLTLLTIDRYLDGNELETISDGTFKQFKILQRW